MKRKIASLALAAALLLQAAPLAAAYSDMGGHWAEPAAARWEASQLIETWKEDTFAPEQTVTGQELSQILTGLFGTSACPASAEMVSKQDAVAAIARTVSLEAQATGAEAFTDFDAISAETVQWVNAMVQSGYIQGYDGRFEPERAITRAEVVTILDQITAGGNGVAKASTGVYISDKAENGTLLWKGIEFANAERFKAPEVVPESSTVYICDEYGQVPMQDDRRTSSTNRGDDCLNLNIWAADNDLENKSVYMYIFPGAQIGGDNTKQQWHEFVEENPDIIVVQPNYRAGYWGSVDLSNLEGYDAVADEYQYSNNLGRLDLLACLKWINENIEAFGGNPDDVTIGGHSAGSNNVTCLLMMEEAHPYFQKAICQASFCVDISLETKETAEFVSQALFDELGVTTIDEFLACTNDEILEAQINISSASNSGSSAFATVENKMFSPVIDGVVIPENYYEYLLEGGCEGITVMFGSNAGEYDQQYVDENGEPLSDEDALAFTIEQNWGKLSDRGWNSENAQAVIDEFYSHNEEYGRDDWTAAKDLKNDLYLRCGAIMFAEALSNYTDVYFYHLDWDITPENNLRASHGSENDIIARNWDQVPEDMLDGAEMISTTWASFIRNGDPNNDLLGTTWTTYNGVTHDTLYITDTPTVVEGVRQKDVDLLLPLFREYPLLESFQHSSPGFYAGYTEAEYDGYNRYSVYVPVTDGTQLAVDYYIPTKDGVEEKEALPVVFTYTPYGRRRADNVTSAEWFTRYGYAFAVADVRGMGASYGTRDSANSPQEAQDGADIVSWIHEQSWCNGKIGTIGSSYVGQTQLAILSKSQLVDASVIGCTDYNKYDGWIRGGVPRAFGSQPDTMWTEIGGDVTVESVVEDTPAVDADSDKTMLFDAVSQHVANGLQIPMFQRLLWRDSYSEEVDGEYWNLVSASTNKDAINNSGSAIYLMGGLYDVFRRDTVVMYENLTTPKKLTIGPWYHTKAKVDPNWEVEQLRWFDYWLKGIDNGIMDEDPIYLKTANAEENNGYSWHTEWPVDEGSRTTMYLSADAALSGTKSSAETYEDYDVVYGITTGVESTTTEDVDAKGLTFTTAPLEEDFEITGHPMAYIQFEMLTEDDDIDFFVTLSDVDPETGETFLFSDGHLRASLRSTEEAPYDFLGLPWHPANQEDAQPITTGEVYELVIDLMPTSYIVPEGHCIRVTVSNSMDRFYYLGRSEYEADPNCETPDIRLYTGGENASYIEFPNIYD